MSPNVTLYAALAFYALGTLVALASLFTREKRLAHVGLAAMVAGYEAVYRRALAAAGGLRWARSAS